MSTIRRIKCGDWQNIHRIVRYLSAPGNSSALKAEHCAFTLAVCGLRACVGRCVAGEPPCFAGLELNIQHRALLPRRFDAD